MIAEIITIADPLTSYFVSNFGLFWGTVVELGLTVLVVPIAIALFIGTMLLIASIGITICEYIEKKA